MLLETQGGEAKKQNKILPNLGHQKKVLEKCANGHKSLLLINASSILFSFKIESFFSPPEMKREHKTKTGRQVGQV